jgi:hypothetical protein
VIDLGKNAQGMGVSEVSSLGFFVHIADEMLDVPFGWLYL